MGTDARDDWTSLNALDLHHCIRLVGSISAAATSNTGRYADGMAVGVGETIPVVCLMHLHLHHQSLSRVGILVSQESPHNSLRSSCGKKDLTSRIEWDIKGY